MSQGHKIVKSRCFFVKQAGLPYCRREMLVGKINNACFYSSKGQFDKGFYSICFSNRVETELSNERRRQTGHLSVSNLGKG